MAKLSQQERQNLRREVVEETRRFEQFGLEHSCLSRHDLLSILFALREHGERQANQCYLTCMEK